MPMPIVNDADHEPFHNMPADLIVRKVFLQFGVPEAVFARDLLIKNAPRKPAEMPSIALLEMVCHAANVREPDHINEAAISWTVGELIEYVETARALAEDALATNTARPHVDQAQTRPVQETLPPATQDAGDGSKQDQEPKQPEDPGGTGATEKGPNG